MNRKITVQYSNVYYEILKNTHNSLTKKFLKHLIILIP